MMQSKRLNVNSLSIPQHTIISVAPTSISRSRSNSTSGISDIESVVTRRPATAPPVLHSPIHNPVVGIAQPQQKQRSGGADWGLCLGLCICSCVSAPLIAGIVVALTSGGSSYFNETTLPGGLV